MVEIPETLYVKNPEGFSIAYQTVGEGATDLLFLPALPSIEVIWDEPSYAHVLSRLASMGRLISLETRGVGSSDPLPLDALPTPEKWVEDFVVVLDAVGSERATVIAQFTMGPMAMMFAAIHPERINRLVLIDTFARARWAEDYKIGVSPELLEATRQALVAGWGTGVLARPFAPSRADDAQFRRWFGRYERTTLAPATFDAMARWDSEMDVRSILSAISCPTLVLNRRSALLDLDDPLAHGRYLAERIPSAHLVGLEAIDGFQFSLEAGDEAVDLIEEFITGAPPVRDTHRAFATVLFTDIVSSTEHASRLGDLAWTRLLNQHDAIVVRELDRHRGRRVNPTGDGILATFDGPTRGVRCALAIVEALQVLGIEVRAGLHAGEVERRGDDIGGIAVHIGQRISSLAGPGEVLVSRTVTDLVVGSGLRFEDRGEHELKGVSEPWQLFAVAG